MVTTTERSVHSIRLNEKLVKICNKTGIPLNSIIETCLVHFATLDDKQRIKFLSNYDPNKVNYSKLNEPSFNYAKEAVKVAKQELGDKPVGRISMKALIAIGLTLLAAMFLTSNKE